MNDTELKAAISVMSREELIFMVLAMVKMNLRHLQAEIMVELKQLKGVTIQ